MGGIFKAKHFRSCEELVKRVQIVCASPCPEILMGVDVKNALPSQKGSSLRT